MNCMGEKVQGVTVLERVREGVVVWGAVAQVGIIQG